MRHPAVAAFVLFATLTAASASAQSSSVDADMKEIQSYKLSIPVFKQVVAATRNIMTALKQDARVAQLEKLKAEAKKLSEKEEFSDADTARLEKLGVEIEKIEDSMPNILNGSQSLSDMERVIQKEPAIANALKAAGLSGREYAKFMLAFFQAALVHGFQKAGTIKELPKELQTSAENIKFIDTNQAEIAALMAELKAMEKEPQ